MKRRLVLSAAVVAMGALALVGCSSSSTPAEGGESASMVGGDPGTWTPLQISQNDNGTTIDMVVGQAAIFTDLPDDPTLKVESSDPAVVEASQAEGTGEVTAVAGLVAKAPGTATITALYPDQPADQGGASNVVMTFTVNVSAE